MILQIFLPILFYIAKGGRIVPKVPNHIESTIANAGEFADYTFRFNIQTQVPNGGELIIKFPYQFVSTLGINIIEANTCTYSCTIANNTVNMKLSNGLSTGVDHVIAIKKVLNPTFKGGTGNFHITTKIGIKVLDENLIYSIFGIAGYPGNLSTVNIGYMPGNSSSAGDNTTIKFELKSSREYIKEDQISFIFPSSLSIMSPVKCGFETVNNYKPQGNYSCLVSGQEIRVSGFNSKIPAQKELLFYTSVTLPSYSGDVGPFIVSFYRTETKVVYDWRRDIIGLIASPGLLTNVSISNLQANSIKSKGKIIDYNITFITKNEVPEGGVFEIILPNTIKIPKNTEIDFCQVGKGIEDISESIQSTVICEVHSLNISNFKKIAKGTAIEIHMRIINPTIGGISEKMTIKSYRDSSKITLIDQFLDLQLTIVDIGSSLMTFPSGVISDSYIAGSTGKTLTFKYIPSNPIPVSSVINFKFPSEFNFGSITAVDCLTDRSGTTSQSCAVNGKEINVTLKATSSFSAGVEETMSITKINLPIDNGTYFIDINVVKPDGTLLDSYNDYIKIEPSNLATSSVQLIGNENSSGGKKESIVEVKFTTEKALKVSPSTLSSTSAYSMIQVRFFGFDSKLGTTIADKGDIVCLPKAGIVSVLSNETVLCRLIHGTLFEPPAIQIYNYNQVAPSTNVHLLFPKILNPSTSGNYNLELDVIEIRNKTKVFLSKNILVMVIQNPGTPTTITPATVFPAQNVNSKFSISFTLSTAIANNEYSIVELPTFSSGFIRKINTVAPSATLGTEVFVFPAPVDWIVFKHAAPGSATISYTLGNLLAPSYVNPLSTPNIKFRIISTLLQEKTIINPTTNLLLQPNVFVKAEGAVDKKGLGYVDVNYNFTFTLTDDLPDESQLLISFPAEFSLLTSEPLPSCTTTNVNSSIAKPLEIYIGTANITLRNIGYYKTTIGAILLNCKGIKNPSSVTGTPQWNVETLSNGGVINRKLNFFTFTFESPFKPGRINFTGISVFPLNAGFLAQYNISFLSTNEIPINSTIEIKFPSRNYPLMPADLNCYVFGAIDNVQSCYFYSSILIIKTSQVIQATKNLTVSISPIRNPSDITTDGFLINSKYDNTILDYTYEAIDINRKIKFLSPANSLNVSNIIYTPKNEGEASKYEITLQLSTNLTTDMLLQFHFPNVFDQILGEKVICTSSQGLIGYLSCTIVDRVLSVTGFDPFSPKVNGDIVMILNGIVNPDYKPNSNSGQIKVATYKKGDTIFTDANENSFTIESLPAPNWAYISNITINHFYSRIRANYEIIARVFENVPTKDFSGQFLIELPIQYDQNDRVLTCTVRSIMINSNLDCEVKDNLLIVNGGTKKLSGVLNFSIYGLLNPVVDGKTDSIILRTFDGFNQKVIERSYANLDKTIQNFVYIGPRFTVNNGKDMYVERGTSSVEIPISLDRPCLLNLTIKTFTQGISINPPFIEYKVGEIVSYFRVSVPQNFAIGTYYISWETFGDFSPPIYSPLKRNKVFVTKDTRFLIS